MPLLDDLWPEDPEVARIWHERRRRRAYVRALGWVFLFASSTGLGALATIAPAGEAIACWASMGHVGDARIVTRELRAAAGWRRVW